MKIETENKFVFGFHALEVGIVVQICFQGSELKVRQEFSLEIFC